MRAQFDDNKGKARARKECIRRRSARACLFRTPRRNERSVYLTYISRKRSIDELVSHKVLSTSN